MIDSTRTVTIRTEEKKTERQTNSPIAMLFMPY